MALGQRAYNIDCAVPKDSKRHFLPFSLFTDCDTTPNYTLCSEKTTYVFDYNSGISWWIFILFMQMESGMGTLQRMHLMAR